MKSLKTFPLALIMGALFFANAGICQKATETSAHLDSSPLDFVENQGQWHENVLFKTHFDGVNALFIEEDGFTYLLTSPEDVDRFHEQHRGKPSPDKEEVRLRQFAYKVKFLHALGSDGSGIAQRGAYHNYYLGNDPSKWTNHVSLFGKVVQENIYEGIHMETYSRMGRLKYDLLVQPGADASKIKIEYDGADGLELRDGNLHIFTSIQTIQEMAPVAYQMIGEKRVGVDIRYVLDGNVLSFDFPNGYDETAELIIDPTVVAATLSGSSSENFGHTATFDLAGNVYGGGIAFGTGYPTTTGAFQSNFGGGGTDIAVSKYDPEGSNLLFATYVGGNNSDYPHSLVTDFNQQVYIYGSTLSSNYPVSANAVSAYLWWEHRHHRDHPERRWFGIGRLKLFWWKQYRRPKSIPFSIPTMAIPIEEEIVLDNQNNVYIVSSTTSNNFPVTPNAFQTTKAAEQDAVVFKASNDLSLFFGPPSSEAVTPISGTDSVWTMPTMSS